MRLLLFDIDGTLMISHGAGRRAMMRAYEEVFGTAGDAETMEMAGMTDPLIARAALAAHGFSPAEVDALFPELWRRYAGHLARELAQPANGRHAEAYPGVRQLLSRLHARDDVVLGLLTGNIEVGAWLKLGYLGLDRFFTFGAFGNEGPERDKLPAVAIRRAELETGYRFTGREVVVIGDTPADIACGRHLSVRTVAVATGPFDEETLRAAGADVVLPDFRDTEQAVAALLG